MLTSATLLSNSTGRAEANAAARSEIAKNFILMPWLLLSDLGNERRSCEFVMLKILSERERKPDV
jgi:hypothetical protein